MLVRLLIFVIYLVAALVYDTQCRDKQSTFLALFFTPASIVLLLLLTVFGSVFWFFYPERHVHDIDIDGSDEEQRLLNEYRSQLAQKPFARRVAEKFKLRHSQDPPWPFSE